MTDNTSSNKKKSRKTTEKKSKPASSPEAREKQLTRLAVDLAEKQLRDGTASPSIINHYLKIASSRESLERDILEKQAKMIEAKAQNITRDREVEELTKSAIEAMRSYTSSSD